MALIPIEDLAQLGEVVRATRKQQGLRQDEIARLSHSFVGGVESGKHTLQAGKLFELLRELGIRLYLEPPPGAGPGR